VVVATPDPAFRALPDILAPRSDIVIFDCWRLLPADGHRRIVSLGVS
jgi:hypothetical protein